MAVSSCGDLRIIIVNTFVCVRVNNVAGVGPSYSIAGHAVRYPIGSALQRIDRFVRKLSVVVR